MHPASVFTQFTASPIHLFTLLFLVLTLLLPSLLYAAPQQSDYCYLPPFVTDPNTFYWLSDGVIYMLKKTVDMLHSLCGVCVLKTEKIKTHVMFPSELLMAIDKTVGGRKRSKFIVEASKKKLEELQVQEALEVAAGCWKDEKHPDLRTQQDIRTHLKKIRDLTEKRIKRLGE